MKKQSRIMRAVLALAVIPVFAALLSGCGDPKPVLHIYIGAMVKHIE